MSELSRLRRLREQFGGALIAGVLTGIGDDAAVLAGSLEAQVWTVDSAVEGTHFRRDWMTLGDVGFRSLMAAASDLAAMGAAPRGVLASLVLPASFTDEELDALAAGQKEAADALGTAIIGGNLASGRELSITTTLIGQARRPLLRSGARDGDVLAVAGPLGLARAGLDALRRDVRDARLDEALRAFRRPVARIAAGLAAAALGAHGAMDVSDGLGLDATRFAEESGLALALDATRIVAAAGEHLVRAAAALSCEALELALWGGEDYALLAAFAGEAPDGFTPIGRFVAGSGVVLEGADGSRQPLAQGGFDHFP